MERELERLRHELAQSAPSVLNVRDIARGPYGLVERDLRRIAWPLLVGVGAEGSCAEDAAIAAGEDSGENYRDYEQIERDVERSLIYFEAEVNGVGRSTVRRQLRALIHDIFRRRPDLHYFQGFHDLATVILLVCGPATARRMMERLCDHHIRASAEQSLESISALFGALFPLIAAEDRELFVFLERSGVQPFFALSWVLTWFSHDVDQFDVVSRLFDVLLCSHPTYSLYISAAVLLSRREAVLMQRCDFSSVHAYLNRIWDHQEDLLLLSAWETDILPRAASLYRRWPPLRLSKMAPELARRAPLQKFPYPWMPPPEKLSFREHVLLFLFVVLYLFPWVYLLRRVVSPLDRLTLAAMAD